VIVDTPSFQKECCNPHSSNASTGRRWPANASLAGSTSGVTSHTLAEKKMGIFKMSEDNDRPEVASVPRIAQSHPAQSRNVSVIGPTLVFKGELSADEDLIIDGHIEGTIAHHKKHLTVGKQGRIKADIHASSVIVLGQVVGDIHSEGMVSLAKGSDVAGNIFCGRIVMEDGARFKGKIDMGGPVKVKEVIKEQPVVEAVRKEVATKVAGQTAKSSVL
jgi:cytoskeletal protein CcmA (bactofilin family)